MLHDHLNTKTEKGVARQPAQPAAAQRGQESSLQSNVAKLVVSIEPNILLLETVTSLLPNLEVRAV